MNFKDIFNELYKEDVKAKLYYSKMRLETPQDRPNGVFLPISYRLSDKSRNAVQSKAFDIINNILKDVATVEPVPDYGKSKQALILVGLLVKFNEEFLDNFKLQKEEEKEYNRSYEPENDIPDEWEGDYEGEDIKLRDKDDTPKFLIRKFDRLLKEDDEILNNFNKGFGDFYGYLDKNYQLSYYQVKKFWNYVIDLAEEYDGDGSWSERRTWVDDKKFIKDSNNILDTIKDGRIYTISFKVIYNDSENFEPESFLIKVLALDVEDAERIIRDYYETPDNSSFKIEFSKYNPVSIEKINEDFFKKTFNNLGIYYEGSNNIKLIHN